MSGMAGNEVEVSEVGAKGMQVLGTGAYKGLMAILEAISASSTQIIVQGLAGLLESDQIRRYLDRGVMPYIYTTGFLSYAGREINSKSMSRCIAALGITPDDGLIDMLLKAKVRSHLLYVYAFFFLLANGRPTTKESMERVVEALDMKVDQAALAEVLNFLKEYNEFQEVKF